MLCYDMVNKQINRYKLWNSEEYMMHTIEPSPCVVLINEVIFVKKFLYAIFLIITLPVVVFEYIYLIVFWGAADVFNFFAIPVNYIMYLLVLLYLKRKIIISKANNWMYNIVIAIVVPLLSVISVYVIAMIIGIDIKVQ